MQGEGGNSARETRIDGDEIALRRRFLALGDTDVELLRRLHEVLPADGHGFTGAFYDMLRTYPPLAGLLRDDATVTRLRAAHERYFRELTAGRYDAAYVARRLEVGLTHARIGLEPKWYIGAFRAYLSAMMHTVWDRFDGRREDVLPTLDALLKIALFDLGLTLDTYFHADKRRIALRDRAIESSVNGIFIADAQQADYPLIYVNPAFERALGARTGAVLGQPCICRNHGDDGYAEIRHAIASGSEGTTVLELHREDAERRWVELFLAPVRNEADAITHYVGVLNDVTRRKDAEERLNHLASHDPLTGLPNRMLFHDRLRHAIARRNHGALAVLFLDLDRFKLVNDGYGHDVGDALLREVAARLSSCLRAEDTVARLGGDEFVVLIEDLPGAEFAATIAGKIAARLAEPVVIGGRTLPVSSSVGIALHPRDGSDPQTLLKNADTAMYRAKEAGRGGFCFYAGEMNAQAHRRLDLENGLRRALAEGQLEVHYQPQVSLADGRVSGVEALVRWRHPRDGMIGPAEFIPIAEETGLIVPLGEHVLRTACKQLADWDRRGLVVPRLAVNLSARQFRQPDLADRVCRILDEIGLSSSRLELEITESTVMRDADDSVETLRHLRARGISVAIDDFGTGYSSLSQLKRLPIDTLKIDRSFIEGIPGSAEDVAIVGAIAAMARSLGLKLVAEGVEHPAQRDFLRTVECEEAQGWLFGRPLPADVFVCNHASGRAVSPADGGAVASCA